MRWYQFFHVSHSYLWNFLYLLQYTYYKVDDNLKYIWKCFLFLNSKMFQIHALFQFAMLISRRSDDNFNRPNRSFVFLFVFSLREVNAIDPKNICKSFGLWKCKTRWWCRYKTIAENCMTEVSINVIQCGDRIAKIKSRSWNNSNSKFALIMYIIRNNCAGWCTKNTDWFFSPVYIAIDIESNNHQFDFGLYWKYDGLPFSVNLSLERHPFTFLSASSPVRINNKYNRFLYSSEDIFVILLYNINYVRMNFDNN